MSRKLTYRRLTAEQFRAAQAETGIGGETLARLCGSAPDRVNRWSRGDEEVPPWLAVMMAMLTVPEARALAWAVVDSMIEGETDAEIGRQARRTARQVQAKQEGL